MSVATNSLRRSMVADERLSNGTMTAKISAPERARIQGRESIETLWYRGKCGKMHIFAAERVRARAMSRFVRTNDAVLVSAVGALLDAAYIPHVVLDQNMSV